MPILSLESCKLYIRNLRDTTLDLETGWTPLHYSAVQNQPRAAKMLVENGAYLEARCNYGQRPIDYAFNDGKFELCEILRKPDERNRMVGDIPKELLDELFLIRVDKDEYVRFLSFNEKDPSDDIMEYFRQFWPNVRPRSRAEEVDRETQQEEGGKTSYRDLKTKDYGIVVEIGLEQTGDEIFEWKHREASGPFLSGGGSSGKITKEYGYWVKQQTASWTE